jgi:hypothetical protein
MGFLDGYEASLARLTRWNTTYPTGRIETRIVEFSAEKGYVLVEAKAYRYYDDLLPAGIDFAHGFVSAYQPNMKRWFVEDTVTSAIMRVQQLVMGGAERTVREVMEQIEKTPATVANAEKDHDYWTTKFGDVPSFKTAAEAEQSGVPSFGSSVDEIAKQLGGQLVPEAPKCDHGHRVWRESKPGAAKVWAGYFCSEREKANQCQPHWYVVGNSGKWSPQL